MNEASTCPLCEQQQLSELLSETDRHGRPLRTIICRGCGLVRVDPMPDSGSLNDFYTNDYRLQYKGSWHPRPKHVYRDTRGAIPRARRLLEIYRPGMKVLDIGCGAGFFLRLLRALSIEASGLEPNRGYADFARNELGIENVYTGTLDEYNPGSRFDIITINHVFEHLPDPVGALARMRGLLVDDGAIIMEIPNIESTYHAPHRIFHIGHLYWYNPITIHALLRKAGFRVADMAVPGGDGHINLIIRPRPESDVTTLGILHGMLIGNFHRTRAIRDRHTRPRHYLSPAPYRRVLRKCLQYSREFLATWGARSPRTIADRICQAAIPELRRRMIQIKDLSSWRE
ncbi:MAG TPA: class I SAM-dependent methyltransferase [Gammaproteobacteria bacterium]|nr:class I SAM-dependent methyltransferase [Gammaproteobacteria bacterium]